MIVAVIKYTQSKNNIWLKIWQDLIQCRHSGLIMMSSSELVHSAVWLCCHVTMHQTTQEIIECLVLILASSSRVVHSEPGLEHGAAQSTMGAWLSRHNQVTTSLHNGPTDQHSTHCTVKHSEGGSWHLCHHSPHVRTSNNSVKTTNRFPKNLNKRNILHFWNSHIVSLFYTHITF